MVIGRKSSCDQVVLPAVTVLVTVNKQYCHYN